ncbi:uncharacterized protein LOC128869714 [Anastrepha ludens]|uniref:uncharacterized protein LOC128869713 n=1 Tax=Anastrepha ludens TaxID=28586 RepID=UPI0023B0F1E7|nr:uncharacterized protein LOC128869713 [Anastrepha ludens]XP_053968295.1 uncharacterized protein LOC128869714 [Anastrepha ludens]
MPDGVYLVGYADDVAAVITARDLDAARRKFTQTMTKIKTWLDSQDLSLAPEKTELILFTRARIPVEVTMPVYTQNKTTSKVVKYLGIKPDHKLTYWAQIQYAAQKSTKTISRLSRLMANIGGPIASRRKPLTDTMVPFLLYGCEVWADTLKTECSRKILSKAQRTAALRVASAYRTLSEAAVLIISGTIPIDLLARERKEL